ncbi:MAG TPA: hypothetical protein ENI05_15565 [Porticoccus sp.]|nr:hypothetical protein [Porticoccus sp.]
MGNIQRGLITRDDIAWWDGITRTSSRVDATGGTVTGLNLGDAVDILQVFGDGSDRIKATIDAAISRGGSTNLTLLFSPGTWTIDDDLTIASNFSCYIFAGAVFNVSAGKTLTFSGPVLRESDTWTSGSGTVTHSSDRLGVELTASLIDAAIDATPTALSIYPIITAESDVPLTTDDIDESYIYDDPRRYGAAMDGATNDTAAFDKQVSVGVQTIKLYGTYAVADLDIGDSSIDGQNIGKFVAYTGATDVLVVPNQTGDSWHYRYIKDLEIDATGDSIRTVNGITIDRAGAGGAAGIVIDTCYIRFANIGIYKPTGSIGDHVLSTTVKSCNYGYFAVDSPSPLQHTGANLIRGGEWSGHRKAAIYISNDTLTAGGSILDGPIIESNVGFGLYIDGYNFGYTPLELRTVWFENNNTGSTTVDLGFGNGAETVRDILFRDADHVLITGNFVPADGFEFINSMATMDGCTFNPESVVVRDSTSVVRVINANIAGIDGSSNVIIESITTQRVESGNLGAGMKAQIVPRDNIVYSLPSTGVGVFSETFAHSDVTIRRAGTRTLSSVKGNGLYRWHNSYTLNNETEDYTALIPLVLNKYYVYTVSIMVASGEVNKLDFSNNDFDLLKNLDSPLRDNVTDGEWATLGGVVKYTDTEGSGNVRLRFLRTVSTSTVMNLGPIQVVQFDTLAEAIDYFNSRSFWQGTFYEYNGVKTLSGGTSAVDFTDEGFVDQLDTAYGIDLTGDSSTTPFWSSRLQTGFTINGGTTDVVNWRVYRRDL